MFSAFGPNTATELVNTTRGRRPACRQASSSNREPSTLTRIPRSKLASASPLTTAARWNTVSISERNRGRQHAGARDVPASASTRGSSSKARRLLPIQQHEPLAIAREQRLSQQAAEETAGSGDEHVHERKCSACFEGARSARGD